MNERTIDIARVTTKHEITDVANHLEFKYCKPQEVNEDQGHF